MLRAFDFALSKAALLRAKRDQLKPEVIWNIEEGLKLTVEQLERAEAQRVAMTARTLEFFHTYDLLLTPATIVAPFPVENRYVAECAGKKFDNYVEWLGIVYAITLVCCPALSLPCGFTASGLPVGLQMVAPPRGEAQLLAGAKAMEDILGVRGTTPIDPRAPKKYLPHGEEVLLVSSHGRAGPGIHVSCASCNAGDWRMRRLVIASSPG